MHAVVIGSGIAGLGAALRLRAAGAAVTVLERRSTLGGKLHTVEHSGCTFDAGPSFLTQPWRLDELFSLFDEERSEHLPIEAVDPSVLYRWRDGTSVRTPRDRAALVRELTRLGSTPERIEAYLDEVARCYDDVAQYFVKSDINRPRFWLAPSNLQRLAGSLGMLGRTFHSWNTGWFPDSPRLVQLLCRYATYAGSNPYQTPAFMSSIADVELRQGIFYPEGGLCSVPQALIALGRRHGITYRTDSAVEAIERTDTRVIAVRVGDDRIEADTVISAIDPQHIAPMLDRPRSPTERSFSALIWFWCVDEVPAIDLHNIFFSDDYTLEFEQLTRGEFGSDPTIYVNCSSIQTPSHAPAGRQNWFVMLNAPADDGQDWPTIEARMREVVLNKLQGIVGPITIHGERTYTPLDIAETSGSWKGSIYGPASNGMLQLFAKQRARDTELNNLFYCGGSSHPGGGIPMCLSSAKIAVDYAL